MAQNYESFFVDWDKQKQQYKMNQWEFFNSVFSFGKLRCGSITYSPGFLVLYL